MTFHATGAETNGRCSLVEVSGGPGGEPPKHIHKNEDELFHLLEGKLKVFRGDEELTLYPGDSGFLPRNVPHTFKILSPHARWLVYITPAGFEDYFRELGESATEMKPQGLSTPPDVQKLIQVGSRYGLEFLR